MESNIHKILGKFNFYTVPIQTREVKSIYTTCFSGLSLQGCQMPEADDLIYLNQIPYQQTFNGLGMQPYCLQCCGVSKDNTDTWDMYCPLNSASLINYCNVYGYELRLATNRFVGDTGYVKCPLRRSACSYDDAGNTLGCNRVGDKTWLVGYTATLWIESHGAYFRSLHGASRCEIESIESNVSMKINGTFHEKIVIIHNIDNGPQFSNSNIYIVVAFIFAATLSIGIYLFLYCYRKTRCSKCQQKLILSTKLCISCQFFGLNVESIPSSEATKDPSNSTTNQLQLRSTLNSHFMLYFRNRWISFFHFIFRMKRKPKVKTVSVKGKSRKDFTLSLEPLDEVNEVSCEPCDSEDPKG